ncbi:MAG TPA: hypothetical protein VHW90_04970 [Stellaceae bacterium]|jgi:hypothetical protein|nr:hypothetical protein [Stellaceae bacterium]
MRHVGSITFALTAIGGAAIAQRLLAQANRPPRASPRRRARLPHKRREFAICISIGQNLLANEHVARLTRG